MKWHNIILTTAAIAVMSCFSSVACAEGRVVVEDFEDGNAGWFSSASALSSVTLGPLLVSPIEGTQSLEATANLIALGNYTIANTSLDVQVPPSFDAFQFKMKALVGVSVLRSLTVKITGQDNVVYTASNTDLAAVSIGSVSTVNIPRGNFSPAINDGTITRIKGISLQIGSVVGLNVVEAYDSFAVTWDDSGVSYLEHTLAAVPGTLPGAGAGHPYNVNWTVTPPDVDISKFNVRVGYNTAQVQLSGVTNNTGQPGSTVSYTVGAQTPIVSTGINVFNLVQMDAYPALQSPASLGALNFITTATYTGGPITVILMPEPGLDPLLDADWNPIPVTFDDSSNVEDWNLY